MKKRLTLAILASLVCAANGAITVQFSDNNNALTNFLNGAGTGTTAMVWGLVVDTAGDGFAGSNALTPYDEGFSLAATSNPLNMTVSNGLATDDRLFIAAGFLSVNATVVDDAAVGINRALSMTSMNLTSGVAFGQSFAVIWFDSTTRVATPEGLKYGIFTPPTSNVALCKPATANQCPWDAVRT